MKKKELVRLLNEALADSPNLELRLETLGKILINVEENPNVSPRDICCTCGYALVGIVDEMKGNRERVEGGLAAAQQADELKAAVKAGREKMKSRGEGPSRIDLPYPLNI